MSGGSLSGITADSTDTLTNKTIDADNNTITNIENADIKSAAAIALDKLAALTASEIAISNGSGFLVSAAVATYPSLAELIHVKGVTSAIQTQIDAKLALAGGTMTGDITLGENASIALDPAGSADGKFTGTTITGTGGATIAFGELVYLLAADSEWYLTDADATLTGGVVAVGIAVTSSTDGNPITVMLHGIIRADAAFPTLTVGSVVYVGVTPGAIQITAPSGTGDIVKVVGHALTANELWFNPSPDWIVIS